MTNVESIRSAVIDALKPLLPTTWRLIPYSKNLDDLSQPVVMLQLATLEKYPKAPKSERLVSYSLVVIEPKKAPGDADDALDDKLIQLLDAIDEVPGLLWTKAERGVVFDSYPSFGIDIQFHYTKVIDPDDEETESEVTP